MERPYVGASGVEKAGTAPNGRGGAIGGDFTDIAPDVDDRRFADLDSGETVANLREDTKEVLPYLGQKKQSNAFANSGEKRSNSWATNPLVALSLDA